MKTRETFEEIRSRKKEYFTLRVKMVIAVQIILVGSTLLTVLFDFLIKSVFRGWKFPILWEFVIVSFILGSIAAFFISKYFFTSMKKLRQAMDSVADGDFCVRLDPEETNSGEVKELYAGFNLMTKELESTEVLQTDFVSNVSHEFKTPISAIEGYATLLQNIENVSSKEAEEYIDKILFNTRRLSSLAGNILLLSKLDNQIAFPEKHIYRLDEQIRQSLLLLENQWTNKEIEFDVELEDTEYYGCETLMQHVWYNLISNAVKFNRFGGNVRLTLENDEESIKFTVSDSGEGIEEGDIKRIFDKFYQADSSHKQEGNGLGLALVKKIVTLSGGTVFAENLSGGGCRFTVILNKDSNKTK